MVERCRERREEQAARGARLDKAPRAFPRRSTSLRLQWSPCSSDRPFRLLIRLCPNLCTHPRHCNVMCLMPFLASPTTLCNASGDWPGEDNVMIMCSMMQPLTKHSANLNKVREALAQHLRSDVQLKTLGRARHRVCAQWCRIGGLRGEWHQV